MVDVCQHHTVAVSATRVPRAYLGCSSQISAALRLLHAADKDGLCELILCCSKNEYVRVNFGQQPFKFDLEVRRQTLCAVTYCHCLPVTG